MQDGIDDVVETLDLGLRLLPVVLEDDLVTAELGRHLLEQFLVLADLTLKPRDLQAKSKASV